MFRKKIFLSRLRHLKKCDEGVVLIVTALLFSSFLAISDLALGVADMMREKDLFKEVVHNTIYNMPKSFRDDFRDDKQKRISYIRQKLRQNLEFDSASGNHYLTPEKIDFIANQAGIRSLVEGDNFYIGISVKHEILPQSFIWGALSKLRGGLEVSVEEAAKFEQQPTWISIVYGYGQGKDNEKRTEEQAKEMILQKLLYGDDNNRALNKCVSFHPYAGKLYNRFLDNQSEYAKLYFPKKGFFSVSKKEEMDALWEKIQFKQLHFKPIKIKFNARVRSLKSTLSDYLGVTLPGGRPDHPMSTAIYHALNHMNMQQEQNREYNSCGSSNDSFKHRNKYIIFIAKNFEPKSIMPYDPQIIKDVCFDIKKKVSFLTLGINPSEEDRNFLKHCASTSNIANVSSGKPYYYEISTSNSGAAWQNNVTQVVMNILRDIRNENHNKIRLLPVKYRSLSLG
ncbi:hypothetical protein [Candidatus Liberibacter sp.]|uniref:hypothetical protein n=1 Tax=Candidatus Liberibacter sp. TaxID=34022 RepID=UPI0015F59500|nr:hypothetical protein [Candidatus Liberibacter sp.]MBA5723874.1 hypothetical protein [Candidatus Liberibacter sp.]